MEFMARSSRRHKKIGTVERKSRFLKTIMNMFSTDISPANIDQIVPRSTFLSHMFSGSRLLSSLQIAKGYQGSFLGILRYIVPKDLLEADKEQSHAPALKTLRRSQAGNNLQPEFSKADSAIRAWKQYTENTEEDGCIAFTVLRASQHFLEAKKASNKRPTRLAHEYINFEPKGLFAQQVLSCSLEQELRYSENQS